MSEGMRCPIMTGRINAGLKGHEILCSKKCAWFYISTDQTGSVGVCAMFKIAQILSIMYQTSLSIEVI